MQENFEEPSYQETSEKSLNFSGFNDTGDTSIPDTIHHEEFGFPNKDENNTYLPPQVSTVGSSGRQRASSPFEDDRMMEDMIRRSQMKEQSDSIPFSTSRSGYNRANLGYNENSLYVDDLSPMPNDMGPYSRSGRHSPIHSADYRYGMYRNQGDYGMDRLSPLVSESYHRPFPRPFRNDYYSDNNLSPFRYSPIPSNRGYYSPAPFDGYDRYPRPVHRTISPLPPGMTMRSRSSSRPIYPEDREGIPRNLSWMNMEDELGPLPEGSKYRAKSLMCMDDYEVMDSEEIHQPPSRAMVVSRDGDDSHSDFSPRETTTRQRTPMPPIDLVEPEEPSLKATPTPQENDSVNSVNSSNPAEPKDSSLPSSLPTSPVADTENDMDAIFASCKRGTCKEVKKQKKTKPKKNVKSNQDEDMKKSPCRDFENGVCSRGANCKFYHDPAKGKVFVVSLIYSCSFSRCSFIDDDLDV